MPRRDERRLLSITPLNRVGLYNSAQLVLVQSEEISGAMLNRLGDRGILIVALSPAAIFILIAFIVIVGPRLTATPQVTGTPPAVTSPAPTATAMPAATTAATSIPPTAAPTTTPEWIIIRGVGTAPLG